jgi:hypothetical protein
VVHFEVVKVVGGEGREERKVKRKKGRGRRWKETRIERNGVEKIRWATEG